MPEALVVDYGGVLTNSLAETMGGWLAADGIDPHAFRRAMRDLLGAETAAENPVHALERGEIEIPDFERQLAEHLLSTDGSPVQPDGLLARMFSGFRAADDMVGVVRRARQRGLKTALLSNSWGMDYPREGWDELFDVTVISGEVGMRKPDPEIYLLCAQRLGLPPQGCVFVDDLSPNVRGAAAVGMVGVLHQSYEQTVVELEVLLGHDLRE
ncbi:MAG: HAD-superfamily hydrolase, subfamily variant 3 [Frankiales bacterium]|jgi:epoxide hydrolase-like predicted phosphatase|nr:HAD-superfamily hydrolase, subfamily variant 3 [Frankiales bacterium]